MADEPLLMRELRKAGWSDDASASDGKRSSAPQITVEIVIVDDDGNEEPYDPSKPQL